MGILFAKPQEDLYVTGPWMRTPFTDMMSTVGYSDGTPCEKFELNLYDCLQANGPLRGRELCKLYFQDFMECTHHWKTLERSRIMRKERKIQWAKGLVGMGPKTKYCEECPPGDGYAQDRLFDD